VLRLLLCFALLLGAGRAWPQSGPLEDLSAFPSGALTISDGQKTRLDFTVWLANTPARQSQGLMFVRSLPAMRGMLFVHESPRQISMWMKNTYIPLDMLFIKADGTIDSIAERTTPLSEKSVPSKGPVRFVLEINGGLSDELGIEPGDKVSGPAMERN
jgi:uncharacterized membrane protein (UPF0127 family)